MAPRTSRLAAFAAAIFFNAACKPAPVEPPAAPTVDLAPPAPSSTLISTPLDSATTGFTNEMQAAALTAESAELGIQEIGQRSEESVSRSDSQTVAPPLTKAQKKARMDELKAMRREVTKLRQGIDAARDKSVVLDGMTAAIISGRESGGMLGAAEDAPGVWSGAYGGAVEAGERVVENAGAWTELWGRLSRETPPDVDFEKTRVAAVFAGPRPTTGYRTRMIAIATEKERYLLRWYEEGPGAGEPVTDAPTAPFLLVAIPKDERAIRWDKVRHRAGTEGPKTK